MRIVQVSDTHLSHRGGITNRNYERLITFINEDLQPHQRAYLQLLDMSDLDHLDLFATEVIPQLG